MSLCSMQWLCFSFLGIQACHEKFPVLVQGLSRPLSSVSHEPACGPCNGWCFALGTGRSGFKFPVNCKAHVENLDPPLSLGLPYLAEAL